jgi:hypothetical protein
MALCKGKFSEETIRKLRADPHGNTFLSQPCELCGQHVVARNTAGEWHPASHEKPGKYRSGKYAGGKRYSR